MAVRLNLGDKLNSGQTVSDSKLWVSKDGIFTTIQGEGPRLGRLTTFLRLAGCNLACSFCDTSYSWDWTGKNGHVYHPLDESIGTPLAEIAEQLNAKSTQSLTITGGEPLLQWAKLDELFGQLDVGWEINFETNGTICPSWSRSNRSSHVINYVVSPKLSNSGNPMADYTALLNLWAHSRPTSFDLKFVCGSLDDLVEVDAFLSSVWPDGYWPRGHVWIMPQGTNPGVIDNTARLLVDDVIARSLNLTTRYHQHLWNNARAR